MLALCGWPLVWLLGRNTGHIVLPFVIVVLYEEAHSSWQGAVYRMVCVVAGCFIGLVINRAFRRISMRLRPAIWTATDEQDASRVEQNDGD